VELQYYGANCLRITTKKAQIIVDDNLSQLGLKTVTKPSDISLKTFSGIEADGTRVAILGHIFPELSEDQLEQIGMVDIVVVPVGDHGYTMDGVGALKVIKEIEPKVVIPTHYGDKAVKYEVSQAELADALKGLGMEATETVDKYKYKPGESSDSTHLIVLNRQ
jgi:L-ascorbate metabolism protein UlaG (beta-lactamase superfamily)